ncbi:probable serine carboxypeptidase CPVL isoform X2 [Ornithodoros turicata]|uniref:probable serine carboxypeptidase CPVL isoform X2 n=1 Tax=Ornithodoros turicata TaxID=34597 RepID=UPI0031391C0D
MTITKNACKQLAVGAIVLIGAISCVTSQRMECSEDNFGFKAGPVVKHSIYNGTEGGGKKENASLIMWIQGGPAESSLFGQFVENGPIGIDKDGSLYKRNVTLSDDYDLLYLDQPAGAGFSFVNHSDGYVKSMEDSSEDIEKFMRKFLDIFYEYRGREFYVAGESYGVRFAVAAASHLHNLMQKEGGPLHLSLRGVMCYAGFFEEAMIQLDTSDYLLQLGLLDQAGYQTLKAVINQIKDLVYGKDYHKKLESLHLFFKTFGWTLDASNPKLMTTLTGYLYDSNPLQATEPEEHVQFRHLMNNPGFKHALHVGSDVLYRGSDLLVRTNLAQDHTRTVGPELETLLENGYRVLVLLGQLDIKVSGVATEKFLRTLNWCGKEAFRLGTRHLWWKDNADEDFMGYVTQGGNLTLVQLRSAGHYPFFDQPQAATEVTRRFVAGEPLLRKEFSANGRYETVSQCTPVEQVRMSSNTVTAD